MTTRSSGSVTKPRSTSRATTARARKTTTKKTTRKKAAPKKQTSKKTVAKTTTKKTAKKTTATKSVRTTATAVPSYKSDSVPHSKPAPSEYVQVERRLREAGFRGGMSTEKHVLDAFSTDESIFAITPHLVIQPKDQRDVEIAVQVIGMVAEHSSALSLTPRAAGTGLSGGSLTDSIVIDLMSHLHHLVAIEEKHGAITVTAEAGTPWRVIARHLHGRGVYIPSYPASKDLCTIGGAVANNAAGPDSLRYGQTAQWIDSLEVVLADGNTYTVKPLTHREFKTLTEKDNAYARIAREVFALLEEHEKLIQQQRPKTQKNTAGYALWNVLSSTVASFKKGKGTFDLTQLIAGSQGTIGIVTQVTMRTAPAPKAAALIAVPIFDRLHVGPVITAAREYEPLNIELYDGTTFDLALSHPEFFRSRLGSLEFYQVMFTLYSMFHVRYRRQLPAYTVLITLDQRTRRNRTPMGIAKAIRRQTGTKAQVVTRRAEMTLHWQLRHASYPLSKLQDGAKRPAAFLEDMVVPPPALGKFFAAIDKLLKKYNVRAAVHGHGGDGHVHFYPLLDFTNKTTPKLITKMADEFFETAAKFDGSICGEHNDGIIRTPHLDSVFSKPMLDLFAQVEQICDPDDIFNPGKKVNPRFDILTSIRKRN